MKIGLTYDLRQDYLINGFGEEETAEFDRPDTIEAIEHALQSLKHETDRIGNIMSLTHRLAIGDRWDLVFNIAEGLRGFGREAQVPALLDAYDIPYTFSDPLVLSLALHKGMTKRVIRDLGLPTPDFRVVESISDARAVNLPFPLFAKPVAEGTSKGITAASRITSRKGLISACEALLERYRQPVLVETFLPGREFTVGILGTGTEAAALGVMEVILNKNAEPDVYTYVNKEKCEELVEYRLVNGALAKKLAGTALAAYTGLGCRDAGRVDLRGTANGKPNILEVNPLAGLHPEHSDLCIIAGKIDMGYTELIDAIVSSAMKRCSQRLTAYA